MGSKRVAKTMKKFNVYLEKPRYRPIEDGELK